MTGKIFSDWSDKLSTQLVYSTRTQTDNQDPYRGDTFPSVSIVIDSPDGTCSLENSNCTNPFRTIWGSARSGQYETLDLVKTNLDTTMKLLLTQCLTHSRFLRL